ncbi:MAG: arylsulfatase [Planctomycetaceae bacterium]|jgi:arylsulfatase A-like enzyme|nr:arylsulfatase [Planctomycetaceae bacterium]
MRVVNLTLTLLALTATFAYAADDAKSKSDKTKNEKPNIVIFLADDLGWADVGWHGTEIKTPNLDKLADSGLKLEQFYVQPVCTPTRASLTTGRHTLRYGLQSVIRGWDNVGLPVEERTLAQALHDAGYYTAIIGKWHLGEFEEKYLPLQRGFDYHYGLYRGAIHYYEHTHFGGLDWHRNGKTVREDGYSTDLIADDAVRVVQNHETSKPLFLYVPFNAVHGPFLAPPEKELYEQYADLKGTRKIYAGMIASMDNAVGKIVKALEEKGIKENTLIFFSSDNGGPQPKVVTDNGRLRGGKGTLYEGGLRVPAFVVWAGQIKPGTVSQQVTHAVDLYPTLLGIAGAPLEQKLPLDGVDLKDVFLEDKPLERKELILHALPTGGALRVGDWKIIAGKRNNSENTNAPSQTELFNLADDPYEKNNLAESHPEKLKELQERLDYYTKQAVPQIDNKPLPKDFKMPDVWGEFN